MNEIISEQFCNHDKILNHINNLQQVHSTEENNNL